MALVAIVAVSLGVGCGKAGPAAEAPEAGAAREGGAAAEAVQVVGVGDAQQAANLATRLNEQAAKGEPRKAEVHARYGLALSCPCAPITLANAPPTPTQGSYLLPVVKGEPNPADYEVVGEFRLYGHYSGKPIALGEWLRDVGKPPHEDATAAHLKAPYLAFAVDRWCYVPPASHEVEMLAEQASEDEFAARMTKLIDQLRDEGRFCEP